MPEEDETQLPPSVKLSLMENAYDSLNESLAKVEAAESRPVQWKFAVLHLVHSLELMLKQRLHNEHRLLIFEKVEKPVNTVSLSQALERLKAIEVDLDPADIAAIATAIKWRNSITHYETTLLLSEVRANYLLIFEFLDSFHESHFGTGLTMHLQDERAEGAAQLIREFRRDFVDFRGRQMHKSWPWQLRGAQRVLGVTIGPRSWLRIPWGSESHWAETLLEGFVPKDYCHDCAAAIGEMHGPGCDTEECPRCGGQFAFCECEWDASELWGYIQPPEGEADTQNSDGPELPSLP